jgi:predicted transcriptional regulator
VRNLILYISTVTMKEAQGGEIRRAMRRAFDGAFTPMMQFLLESRNLSRDELDQLEEMIRNKKEKGKNKK